MSNSQDKIQRVKKVAFTGIDPGLEGAIVTVTGHVLSDGHVILGGQHRADRIHPIERDKGDRRIKYNMHEFHRLILDHYELARAGTHGRHGMESVHRIVLERSQVRPTERRTVSAQAAVGQAVWEVGLQLAGLEYALLWAQNWKRWAGLIGTEKSAVRQKAVELNDKWLGGTMCSCSDIFNHDGLADAFVMAIYAFCHAAGDE